MKSVQVTVFKEKEILGTTLRASLVSDQELIVDIMGDENCPVIEDGCVINIGTNWYNFTEKGLVDVTGKSKGTENTAVFSTEKMYKDAIKANIEFRFDKKARILFGDVHYKQNPTQGDETVATKEQGTKDAEQMGNDIFKRFKRRIAGGTNGTHGETKDKACKNAENDINACNLGFMAVINLLRNNNADHIADKLQNALYDTNMNAKSLRRLAADINADINDHISFLEEWTDGKNLNEVATLKMIVDGKETKRSLLSLIVGLLLWVQNQVNAFVKKWSGSTVVFPIRVIMLVIKALLDVLRTVAGAAFYIVNGVVCLTGAVIVKLASWALNIVTHVASKIKGWFTKKDTPVVEADAETPVKDEPVTDADIDDAISGAVDEVVEGSLGELFD